MIVIFDGAGQIVKTVQAPDAHVDFYGQDAIVTQQEITDTTHYVEDGELVPFPEKPSPHHEWDWPTKSWLPNLDAARESQRQNWNSWRDQELAAGYQHSGHTFHSDETFMSELHMLIKGYEQGYFTGTSEIRTKGNVVLQMSHIEIETLLLLLGQHRQSIYRQSWTGKDALPGKATLEAIMAGGPPT